MKIKTTASEIFFRLKFFDQSNLVFAEKNGKLKKIRVN